MAESIPTKYVVYQAINDAGKLMYIGASVKHRARWAQHRHGRENTKLSRWCARMKREKRHVQFRVFCYCASYTEMNAVERGLIERLAPPLNIQFTGRANGPQQLRRVAASEKRLIAVVSRFSQLHTETGPELEQRVQRERIARAAAKARTKD
jgi:hypothetical protein